MYAILGGSMGSYSSDGNFLCRARRKRECRYVKWRLEYLNELQPVMQVRLLCLPKENDSRKNMILFQFIAIGVHQ
jgi:hypothetical protein